MATNLKISQEINAKVDWGKLAKDLKEEFNIDDSEEDIEKFCCGNEFQYLTTEVCEPEIEEEHTNDITGDVTLRMD